MILKGLLATWMPFFLTLTSCSPTSLGVKEIPVKEEEMSGSFPSGENAHRAGGRLTEVSVGQLLQQTGLLVARWRSDAGTQRAQVSLGDLQGHVGRRADIQLGRPGYGVVTLR